ncbi:VCBS repeat-containing protein [Streptomyces sp. G2]|uniref:FG-GAP-like repeat-containing protein n=1 Tax=Streptomyces sp. G2 TaxID=1684471 RepID=UPI00202EE2D6|nr:FG-GAP-like repeat-containing protein [Streptomyces sp. G2]MCM1950139.1 VCBS repeat-containing protein [Streptomyces sp. G2]
MSKRMGVRRAAAMSGVAGLLAVAGVTAGAGVAVAADELKLSGYDVVAAPRSLPRFYPVVESGTTIPGKVVIAVGTKPMTDPAGAGAGLPAGYRLNPNQCDLATEYTGILVCQEAPYIKPDTTVPADAADTTLYWGFAYMSAGGDLAAAVKEARSAASLPADGHRGTGKVTVKSRAHALLNTIAFDTPAVPDGGTVRQQLRVHANDAGRLTLRFDRAQGQLTHPAPPIRIRNITSGPGASCELRWETLPDDLPNLACELEAGDHVIGYELAADPGQYAQKLQAHTRYDIYDLGYWDESDVRLASPSFAVQGRTIEPRHGLAARDTTGKLWTYEGTRDADRPFYSRHETGPGWQTYTALTSLSPYTQDLYSLVDVKPSAATRGRGDIAARDASGTLWYYDRHTNDTPYAPRVKVGGGWNVYDRIDGAGDLDRDGYMDLLARDKAGVLWLYKGTGSLTGARFKARVRIGGGWGAYDRLAGGADLTGDGRADLLARDRAGVLWLYKGTGDATRPYTGRTQIGGGWQGYDQLVVTGDLTDDGKTDAVARDRSGVLWLYKGTGKTTGTFTGRTRIGGGWNTYNHLF